MAGRGARGSGGRGAGGVRRKRILPDFTKVGTAVAGGGGGGAVKAGQDDAALVAAMRATLDQTRAQLAGRQSAVPAVPAAGGTRPSLPHGTPLQVCVGTSD